MKGMFMTIYSQHPNRGKVQVLATFATPDDVRSSTVTSVESATVAEALVSALNQVSASATVPVSVWDRRDGGLERYPREHLAALTDLDRRGDLLVGAHSLWYEYAKLVLHEALTDLDDALAKTPAPVRTAVEAELIAEASALRAALREYEGYEDQQVHRIWDFERPFVLFEGGMHELSSTTRSLMDSAELREVGDLDEAVEDLRLLFTAHAACASETAALDAAALEILEEPDITDEHGYFLTVSTPASRGQRHRDWRVTIAQWVPDPHEPDDDQWKAVGEPLVDCVLSARPAADEVVALLDQASDNADMLKTWASTPVGAKLPGTAFVVTEQHIRP